MKNKLISSILSVALLSSGAAFALDMDPKFYVGGEIQGSKLKGKPNTVGELVNLPANASSTLEGYPLETQAKHTKVGPGVFVGTRLHENFGLEAGYTIVGKSRVKRDYNFGDSVKSDATVKHRNVYLDANGYLPVNESVDLIGSVGVGQLKSTMKGDAVYTPAGGASQNIALKKESSKKTGLRLGLGAQYKITENVGTRLMLRHQKGNDFIKSVNTAGLGLFYQF